MRKLTKLCLTFSAIAALALGAAMTTQADSTIQSTPELAPVYVYGTAEKGDGKSLHLTNSDTSAIHNEVVVTTEGALILDAVSGMPVTYEEIREGETVYAYVGPAMTMSLPPMANADVIFVNVPADYQVPAYVIVKDLQIRQDGSAALTAVGGQVYEIPADCYLTPYLTRQMIYIDSLTPGSACVIWTENGSNTASKVMRFNSNPSDHSNDNGDSEASGSVKPLGWSEENGNWYYYGADGALCTGWLELDGKWYYLNPESGIMATGFIQVDGKTYYMLSDGSMLTKPMLFTPGADGSLK
jgi:hypothetical protein